MKIKKKKRGKLIVTLCMLLCTLLLSVGGLTFLKGVNANEETDNNLLELDEVISNDLVNADYNDVNGPSNIKIPVKLNSVDECVDQIYKFMAESCYVASSAGKINLRGSVKGLVSDVNVCDLDCIDDFEHDSLGRTYWVEGFKLKSINNSVIESLFDLYKGLFIDAIMQYNRFYFIDDDNCYKQHFKNSEIEFTDGFNMRPDIMEKTNIYKQNNNDIYKRKKYKERAFRYDINSSTIENAKFTKLISGYKLELDLEFCYPKQLHYVFNLDRYGNVISFTREEIVSIGLNGSSKGINISATTDLKFNYQYNFKIKDSNYKIKLDNKFTDALDKDKIPY